MCILCFQMQALQIRHWSYHSQQVSRFLQFTRHACLPILCMQSCRNVTDHRSRLGYILASEVKVLKIRVGGSCYSQLSPGTGYVSSLATIQYYFVESLQPDLKSLAAVKGHTPEHQRMVRLLSIGSPCRNFIPASVISKKVIKLSSSSLVRLLSLAMPTSVMP